MFRNPLKHCANHMPSSHCLIFHKHRMYCLKKLWVCFLHINNLFAEVCCSRADKAQQSLYWALHVQPKSWFRNKIRHNVLLMHFKKMKEKTNLKAVLHTTIHCQHTKRCAFLTMVDAFMQVRSYKLSSVCLQECSCSTQKPSLFNLHAQGQYRSFFQKVFNGLFQSTQAECAEPTFQS